jgi:hypothetical protein
LFVHKVLKLIIALELRSGTVSIWPSAPPSFSQREGERLRSIGQNGSAVDRSLRGRNITSDRD